jgi:ferredoxin
MSQTAQQRIQEFDARHGRAIYDGRNTIWFEDGACREACPYGALEEPPKDERKYLLNVERFWELSLARAVDAFRDYKAYVTGRRGVNGGYVLAGPIQPEHVEKLEKLKAEVDTRRKTLNEVKLQLDPPPTEEVVKIDAQVEEARRKARAEVDSIEI